tara:strand:- start:4257 stop:4781 length:525 start_codon:yes stop_codon:yes gene_type:complete
MSNISKISKQLNNINISKCYTSMNIDETVKLSVNKKKLQEWLSKGNSLPKCINYGCINDVAIRHWSAQNDPSLKTECSRCSSARIKNKSLDGIIFHKKNYCENKDGILGFICPMDKTRYNEFPCDVYHMDHVDGNHHNNNIDNLKTFCSICHARKGKESGDFNAFKDSSRIHKS